MKWLLIISSVLVMAACNGNDDTASPYQEILTQAPYAKLTDSIKHEPDRDDLYFNRAILLNKNNLPEPALADFKKAWALAKEENYALGVSTILVDKKPDSAIVFLKEAIKEIPKSIFLQITLARAYDAMGKTDEALATCKEILAIDPAQVNTLLLQSELLQKKNDTAGVISALEKAHQVIPLNLEISYKLAYQYAETKNAKAIILSDSLIARDTQKLFAEPYYIKGNYYNNTNDKTKALQLFDETIKRDYHYLNAYIEKGKILLEQKKNNEALKTFTLASTISPAFADAYFWIGATLEATGDKKQAKEYYEKAYGFDKTFTEAKEAAEKIPG